MSTRYNDGSHYENHQRATELQNGAAHAHRVGEQHGKQDHLTGHEQSRQALEHSPRLPPDMARSRSGTRTSRRSLMNSGKLAVVRRDRRMKTGFTRSNNCDPAPAPTDS
jgi:hypothetical protein